MTDSSGSVGSVSGAGGSTAAESARSAQGTNAADATESLASSMVDAATDQTGVDVDRLGQAVAQAQAQAPSADVAAGLQAAVEAQLSPVAAGQLQGAIDRAALSGTVPSAVGALTASPLAGITPPAGLFNAKGDPIDACGNTVQTLSIDRSVPADQTDLAKAVQHVDRIAGGPISGPAYAAAYIAGADAKTLDVVYAGGKAVDAALGVQSKRATALPSTAPALKPANWNYTQ